MDQSNAAATAQNGVRLKTDHWHERLIELGVTLFGRHAYRDLEVEQICEAAAVPTQLFYQRFGTKRDFFIAVLDHAISTLLTITLPRDHARPLDDLEHTLHAYFAFLRSHPQAAMSIAKRANGGPEIEAALEPFRVRTRVGLARALGSDLVDANVDLMLWSWNGLVESIATELLSSPESSTEDAARLAGLALIDLVENGLRMRGRSLPADWLATRERIQAASA